METQRTAEQALTHHARLVLDNHYGLYLQRREIVREFLHGPDAQYPHLLGDQLKDWCEGLVGLEGDLDVSEEGFDPGVTRELLSVAVAWVDWREVAEDYIAEEQEASA